MRIVPIFEEELYSFHYNDENYNEYDRLIELWTDVEYLKNYAQNNNVKDILSFVEEILICADEIQDLLEELTTSGEPLDYYFEQLYPSEYGRKVLALRKGKIRNNKLRIYAIKIDESIFVITGGAIKMSQKMQDHPDTNNELLKLNKAKSYFGNEGIVDVDSFYELINEDDE